jgi:hypothetical protein
MLYVGKVSKRQILLGQNGGYKKRPIRAITETIGIDRPVRGYRSQSKGGNRYGERYTGAKDGSQGEAVQPLKRIKA